VVAVGPTVKTRGDTDGCGCLECRNVDTTTTRRSVLDALVWSLRLFRSDRSVTAFVLGVVVCTRVFDSGLGTGFLGIPVEPLTPVVAVVSTFLVRASVGTVVAGTLTDDPTSVWDGLRRGLTRAPAVFGSLALAMVLALTVAGGLALPLAVGIGAAWLVLDPVGLPAAVTAGGVAFFVPFAVLTFKFWLVPEACVIGQYGPVASLRVSWRLTSHHRRKVLVVVVVVVGSTIGLSLPDRLPAVASAPGPLAATLQASRACLEDLLSALWAGVYAHLYVQGAVSAAAAR
jgi:hypothetical protein